MYKLFLILLLLFAGCAHKTPYASSKSYYIVVKNSKIAVADTGFIKRDGSRFNLQLFSASTPILNLHVDNDVCSGYICMPKRDFNAEFLGFGHYENFIDELFNFQPIYNKESLKKSKSGFEQKIKTDEFDIIYRVENGNLYFKDRKNRVLIKLKELK